MKISRHEAYGFQVDDNSFFLRDIARKGYRSLFDCPYLAMYRDWHTRFGTRFTLNCYYRTADGFTLEQFPDRYKAEWADQADWLRLTVHAEADKPDYPSREDEGGVAFLRDWDRIHAEVARFAGEAVWTVPSIIHWCAIPRSAWPALRARGVTCLGGLFDPSYPDFLKFGLPPAIQQKVLREGSHTDPETGLTLFDVALVCNKTPPEQAEPVLDAWVKRTPGARVIPMWTHEQYFWDFYPNYIPDHPQRVERGLRWAFERNLKPVFFHDYQWGQ
jgi:hypothetical protein